MLPAKQQSVLIAEELTSAVATTIGRLASITATKGKSVVATVLHEAPSCRSVKGLVVLRLLGVLFLAIFSSSAQSEETVLICKAEKQCSDFTGCSAPTLIFRDAVKIVLDLERNSASVNDTEAMLLSWNATSVTVLWGNFSYRISRADNSFLLLTNRDGEAPRQMTFSVEGQCRLGDVLW